MAAIMHCKLCLAVLLPAVCISGPRAALVTRRCPRMRRLAAAMHCRRSHTAQASLLALSCCHAPCLTMLTHWIQSPYTACFRLPRESVSAQRPCINPCGLAQPHRGPVTCLAAASMMPSTCIRHRHRYLAAYPPAVQAAMRARIMSACSHVVGARLQTRPPSAFWAPVGLRQGSCMTQRNQVQGKHMTPSLPGFTARHSHAEHGCGTHHRPGC